MKNNDLFSNPNFVLGIVGGGQLGKMLLQETRRLDLATHVLDPSPQAPSRLACNRFSVGNLLDYQAVYDLGKSSQVVTIEIENVNTQALKALEAEGVEVYPQPGVIELIKSKIQQKQFYQEANIPTAAFYACADRASAQAQFANLSGDWVWKLDTGGFDGRGVKMLSPHTDWSDLPDAPCLLEAKQNFAKELAVVVARSKTGQIRSFPPVEMDFHPKANLVEYVFCPALLPQSEWAQAQELAERLAEKLGIVGILAVELFYLPSGEWLVNEIAPRVHNSGHLSIEGNYTSQFEQHLRAILGLPLGATDSLQSAVMVNLVGEEGHDGPVRYLGLEKALAYPGVYPHLYGKAETRPFRKMGHITVINASLEQARQIAREIKATVKVISR